MAALGRADRTDYWSEDVDPNIARRAATLHVAHFWYPRYSFFANLIQKAVDAARPAVELINEINGQGGGAR